MLTILITVMSGCETCNQKVAGSTPGRVIIV